MAFTSNIELITPSVWGQLNYKSYFIDRFLLEINIYI